MSVPALQTICCFSAVIPVCQGDSGLQALKVISLSHGETLCSSVQTLVSAAHGEWHMPAMALQLVGSSEKRTAYLPTERPHYYQAGHEKEK